MSLLSMLKGKGESGFGYGSTAEQVTQGLDLAGKNILVTGSTSGLGLETVRVLALRGATVYGTTRLLPKAEAAYTGISGDLHPLVCELSRPESVRACVQVLRDEGVVLDAILCNAGIMALPNLEQAHDWELQFFTNHVGHFLLVTGLLDQLAASGRVVMVSSEAHRNAPKAGIELDNLSGERGYGAWSAYGQSKLANILFARHLQSSLFVGTRRVATSLHPGVINTNLGRHMPAFVRGALKLGAPLVLKSIPQGAATQTYLTAHPDGARHPGEYHSDVNLAKPTSHGLDDALARALWEKTEEIVAGL